MEEKIKREVKDVEGGAPKLMRTKQSFKGRGWELLDIVYEHASFNFILTAGFYQDHNDRPAVDFRAWKLRSDDNEYVPTVKGVRLYDKRCLDMMMDFAKKYREYLPDKPGEKYVPTKVEPKVDKEDQLPS